MEMRLLEAFGTVVIGMGVVFAVLILICLIIYCFNIFPYVENKIAAKKYSQQAVEATKLTNPLTVQPVAQTGISSEEVAAIVAAIEAYTGMNSSEFVVRRIVRR